MNRAELQAAVDGDVTVYVRGGGRGITNGCWFDGKVVALYDDDQADVLREVGGISRAPFDCIFPTKDAIRDQLWQDAFDATELADIEQAYSDIRQALLAFTALSVDGLLRLQGKPSPPGLAEFVNGFEAEARKCVFALSEVVIAAWQS